MPEAFGMSASSRSAVQRGLDAIKGKALTPARNPANLATGVNANAHADGLCYGAINARSGSTPTSGYVKFDKIRTSPAGFVEASDDPTQVFNISDHDFEDGDRVRCYWHQNGVEGEGDDKIQRGVWTVGETTSDPQTIGKIYVCRAGALSVANNDDLQLLPLGSVYNFDTATFGVDKPNNQIELKKVGHYAISYGAEFVSVTSGSATTGTLEKFSTYFQSTTAAFTGSGSVITCSRRNFFCTDGRPRSAVASSKSSRSLRMASASTGVGAGCGGAAGGADGGDLNLASSASRASFAPALYADDFAASISA